MTKCYADLVSKFDKIGAQRITEIVGNTYSMRDFDSKICEELYRNYNSELIYDYLKDYDLMQSKVKIVKCSALL